MRRLTGWLRFAWNFEINLYRSLFRFLARRPAVPAGATPVPYVGAVSLLLWAFVVGSAVELVALHLVLPWEGVRLVADIVGLWGLLWMLGFTASHYVYPHILDDTAMVLRAGHSDVAVVPWAAVERVSTRERSVDSSRSPQLDESGALLVPVASRTNVELHLRAPIEVGVRGRQRWVTEVRFFADDPRAVRAFSGRSGGSR